MRRRGRARSSTPTPTRSPPPPLPVGPAMRAAPARKVRGRTEFLRVRLEETGDGPVATALAAQGSGVLSALGSGAALLVGPPELAELPAGSRFPVIVLGGATLAREAPPF